MPAFGGYDEGQVALKDLADVPSALSLVDQPLVERAADRLLPLTDLPGGKGPAFVRGSADPAGPSAGDVLLAVEGTPVPTASAARAALAALDKPTVRFTHRGEEKTWEFRPSAQVELVAFGGERYAYRRQWLKAKQATVERRIHRTARGPAVPVPGGVESGPSGGGAQGARPPSRPLHRTPRCQHGGLLKRPWLSCSSAGKKRRAKP